MVFKRFFLESFACIILIFSVTPLWCAEPTHTLLWEDRTYLPRSSRFTSLAIDAETDIVYLGTEGTLFMSQDKGKTWQQIFSVPGIGNIVYDILRNAGPSPVLYAATGSGLFMSSDDGQTWQEHAHEINPGVVYCVISDGGFLYAGSSSGFFMSNGGAGRWKKVTGITRTTPVYACAYAEEKDFLLALSENGIYRAHGIPRQWHRVSAFLKEEPHEDTENETAHGTEPLPYALIIHPDDNTVCWAATPGSILFSENCGHTWTQHSGAGMGSASVRAFAYGPTGLYAATDRGIWYCNGSETEWVPLGGNGYARDIRDIAYDSSGFLWHISPAHIRTASMRETASSCVQIYSHMENRTLYAHEPTCRETQEAAIHYAEVHPDKIAVWRKAASMKSLLPKFSFGIDRDKSSGIHWDAGSNPDTWVLGPDDENTGWDISCSWDLGDLIWNDAQTSIDVRSKLMVELRDDIIDEVTSLYFQRRRLQLELHHCPPEDEMERLEKDLRLEELTANLDGMTGGWFSRERERRGK